MIPQRRFLIAFGALATVIAVGIGGYMAIEGWSFLDSLYMTVITISTVGYNEVHALSEGGHILSIVLIIGGVGVMLYTLTTIAEYVAEGYFGSILGRRRVRERLRKLNDHFIVCGYGRMGQEIASIFKSEGEPFVVIDLDQGAIDKAVKEGFLYLQGNVTSDETLREANIDRARALIAATGNDADNVYVTLSARGIRPDIFIAARASAGDSEHKLKRAGDDPGDISAATWGVVYGDACPAAVGS